nr:MAG TPA: tail collar domain [Caudoviricetes sp.]
MIDKQTVKVVNTYATTSESVNRQEPSKDQYQKGVVPYDTLPAAWWNWFWHEITLNEGRTVEMLDSIFAELTKLLRDAGIDTNNPDVLNQVSSAVQTIAKWIATEERPGAVVSSSAKGKVSVDGTTGVMTANGLGDVNNLSEGILLRSTTVDAINDVLAQLIKETQDRTLADKQLSQAITSSIIDTVPVGTILPFAGNNIPPSSLYALCNGQTLNNADGTFNELENVLGTAWENTPGDGIVTLPDLRECVLVGCGQRAGVSNHDIYNLGDFKNDMYASHVHGNDFRLTDSPYSENRPSIDGSRPGGAVNVSTYTTDVTVAGAWASHGHTVNIALRGNIAASGSGNVTHGKQIGVYYIIKVRNSVI